MGIRRKARRLRQLRHAGYSRHRQRASQAIDGKQLDRRPNAVSDVWRKTGYRIPPPYNDNWMYNPSTQLWTWMHGSDTLGGKGIHDTLDIASASNLPCSREKATSWVDATGQLVLESTQVMGTDYQTLRKGYQKACTFYKCRVKYTPIQSV